MNLSGYVENLRKRPARDREKLAVIATGVSFAIILVIWLVSFGEINGSAPAQENNPADGSSSQLQDLKNSVGGNKASIEEMFQMPDAGPAAGPDGTAGADNQGTDAGGAGASDNTGNGANGNTDNSAGLNQNSAPDAGNAPGQQQDNSQGNQQGNPPAMPQLPNSSN